MDNGNTTRRGAWNCPFCHATNVTARCGCGPSRAAEAALAGAVHGPAISVDQIELKLPAFRGSRLSW